MSKNILLITDGFFHPPFFARRAVKRAFSPLSGFVFHHVSSLEAACQLDIKLYQAVVLYFHHRQISDRALAMLDDFSRHGGGILAIHSATASFKNAPRYFEILGGRFTDHGAIETMRVEPVDGPNMPFDNLGEFMIHDELYIHALQPGVRVHFQVKTQDQSVPVVWTYQHDSGKVCYVCAGHTTASVQNASVQEILRRGLVWVSD